MVDGCRGEQTPSWEKEEMESFCRFFRLLAGDSYGWTCHGGGGGSRTTTTVLCTLSLTQEASLPCWVGGWRQNLCQRPFFVVAMERRKGGLKTSFRQQQQEGPPSRTQASRVVVQ